jgi:hypothetical protein
MKLRALLRRTSPTKADNASKASFIDGRAVLVSVTSLSLLYK